VLFLCLKMNKLRTMHLFAGIGGGILCDLILEHKPIVAVEWDKYACRILRERIRDGWFPEMSVWEGDVRLFDPSEYAGQVDCIHAGFPCQDISVAGKQAGLGEGTRSGLYREVLRIAGMVRPRYLFLENVSAIISNGLGCVLGDLAEMGYDCRWLCIRASDVGAPHGRDRWFALATDTKSARAGADNRGIWQRIGGTNGGENANAEAGNIRNTEHDGQLATEVSGGIAARNDGNETRKEQAIEPARPSEQHEDVGNANSKLCKKYISRDKFSEQIEQGSFGWSGVASGRSWWESESEVGRVAHGIPNRVGNLKGLGNAQVPLQAAVAWRLLTT